MAAIREFSFRDSRAWGGHCHTWLMCENRLQDSHLSLPFPSLQTLLRTVAENEAHPLPRLPSWMDSVTPTPTLSLCAAKDLQGRVRVVDPECQSDVRGQCWNSDPDPSLCCLFLQDRSPGILSPFPNPLYTSCATSQIPQPGGLREKIQSLHWGKGVPVSWSLPALCKPEQCFRFNEMFLRTLLCSVSKEIFAEHLL